MSSRYISMVCPIYAENRWFISAWYVTGALQSPCWMTRLTMLLSGIVTTDHSTWSGMILICSYTFFRSNTIRNGLLAVCLNIPSMSGRGDVIFQVFLFCSHRSTMVCNCGGVVPGFGMSNIGTVFFAEVIFHHPV